MMHSTWCWLLIGGLSLLPALPLAAAEPHWSQQQLDQFEKHVRPVLAAQCWNCHGEKKAESGLRLDSRQAILNGGDRGPSAQPKGAAASLLIHAVQRDSDLQMPPNGRLSADQIAALKTWIDNGLPWPRDTSGSAMMTAWKGHWAFQPVVKPAVPEIPDDLWSQTPVDRFIVARQQTHGINVSGTSNETTRQNASRLTLIRRATFDLIGFPPTPDDVAEFLADSGPDAFERLVDRLLASPHHGERWGRHWLDVARYADTKGYVFFEEKTYPWAYGYRDYVIQSLNEDKPYDQFVIEQIAADQLAVKADPRALAAMGFLTLGSHFMGNVHDIVDDRIDVICRGLMGLTVTCARCHDHKYDPIPTADYYSLYGVFRSSTEPLVPPLYAVPADTPEYRRFTAELSVRNQNLDDFVKQKRDAVAEGARTRVGEYLMAARAAHGKPATDDFMLIADPGDLNPAMIVRWQAYFEKLAESSISNLPRPKKAIEDMKSSDQATASLRQPVSGQNGQVSGRDEYHPVWGPWLEFAEIADDRFKDDAPVVCQRLRNNVAHRVTVHVNPLVVDAVCGTSPPQSLIDVASRYGDLMKSQHIRWQARVREAVILKRPSPERFEDADAEELRLELYGEGAPANIPLLFGWGFLSLLPDRASQGEYQRLLREVEHWLINAPAAPPRAMVLIDSETYPSRVLVRGNPNRPGLAVERHFLSVLDSKLTPFRHGSGRLELAKAIASSDNPLTTRVAVNRLWQQHFGAGLVRTPGDFGLRSDPPSHPELLDWLASDFTRGWSVKRLHRQLMSSAVYQQSSAAPSSFDPENRLLTRMNRARLDFEATRDALLFVSGQLDDRIGGRSQQMLDGGFHPRRTLYAYLDRQDLPGLLSVFDFPSPAATSAVRDTTTVPPQALYLMNGPFAATTAQLIMQRPDVMNAGSNTARLRQIYQLLLGRRPGSEEAHLAEEYLGSTPSPTQWQRFTHALLLTNEFMFID